MVSNESSYDLGLHQYLVSRPTRPYYEYFKRILRSRMAPLRPSKVSLRLVPPIQGGELTSSLF